MRESATACSPFLEQDPPLRGEEPGAETPQTPPDREKAERPLIACHYKSGLASIAKGGEHSSGGFLRQKGSKSGGHQAPQPPREMCAARRRALCAFTVLPDFYFFFLSFLLSMRPDSPILFAQHDLALNSRDPVSPVEQGARQKKFALPSLPSPDFILIPHMPSSGTSLCPTLFPLKRLLLPRRAVLLSLLHLALNVK